MTLTPWERPQVLDFTSALYLGFCHPSWSLAPWSQLTTGVPAAVREAPAARSVAAALADLIGAERATLGPSTLHLFWDLFRIFAEPDVAIYTDAGLYPIARWGVERAAAQGVPARRFPHHDAAALRYRLREDRAARRRPLVVTDGFCPRCGRSAPLAAYLEAARDRGGGLVLDDTQALGILGRAPGPEAPYGRGGGGSLARAGVAEREVLIVASLAKGFGVPLAMLAGHAAAVRRFEGESATRVHTSPPSAAALHAAAHALAANTTRGDALRLRLAGLVRHFRARLAQVGLSATGGLFPVQTLAPIPGVVGRTLHERLRRAGVRTVLRQDPERGPCISLLLTATHTPVAIDLAVTALARAAGPLRNHIAIGGES